MTPPPPLPPPLLIVSAAVPDAIQAVPHLFQSINSFLLPRTIDAAVYSDLHGVVATFEDVLPMTSGAMDGAAARGRLDIVKRLFSTRSEGCSTEAFVGAAANGHLAVLQWLRRHYPELYDPTRCLAVAAEHGQVDAVRGMRLHRGRDQHVGDFIGPAMEAAAAKGYVGVLEELQPWPTDVTRAFTAAAANDQTHVLEILQTYCSEKRSRTLCSRTALTEIAERGNCAAVEFLLPISDESDVGQMLSAAARADQKRLVQLILRSREIAETRVLRALKEAAENSSYGAIEPLLERFPGCQLRSSAMSSDERRNKRKVESSLSVALRSTVAKGDVRMVGILAERCQPEAVQSALGKAAKRSGDCAMVRLLLDTCTAGKIKHSYAIADAAGNAISCGDIDVAKLLIAECDGSGAGQTLLVSVKKNHLEMVKLCAGKSDDLFRVKALVRAAQGEQIDILEALIEYLDESSILRALRRLPFDVNNAMVKAMLNKCGPTAHARSFTDAAARGFCGLVDSLKTEMDSKSIRCAFMNSASNGHFEVVSSLIGSCDSTSIGCALEAAAMKGKVDVVDFLRWLSDAESISSALASAEEAGQTEVIQLLTRKKPRLE